MSRIAAGAVLARAADRIERDGWHQGAYYPGAGTFGVIGWRDVREQLSVDPLPCCAIGAVMAEAHSAPLYHEAERALQEALGVEGGWEIVDFNDGEYTTKDDMVTLLRKAAKNCGWKGQS